MFNRETDNRHIDNRQQTVCVLIACVLIVCALTGCGYTIHGRANLPFNSISIGNIVNKTFEPKLEDKMKIALVDELMKNGFVIDSKAGHKINGIITTFELRTLSEKAGVAVEYEVIIRGDFKLLDPSGKARALRGQGVFIVSFLSAESLQNVMALKEKAIERALRDLSSEIIASIVYGGGLR
ncbi:MAG: LPS assembly lipoprotein LptE [Thermodesulfovibrionales bacterium]